MRRKRLDTIFIACLLSLIYDRLTCEPTQMNPIRNQIQFINSSNTTNSRASLMNHTVIESSSFSTNNIYSQWNIPNTSKHLVKIYSVSTNNSLPVNETKSVIFTSPENVNVVMPNQINSELKNKVVRRSRRDVLLLYKVVSCATGCNPMHLMGYGCYCGFMGAGVPVDGIDKCCQVHDWCYDRLPCPSFMLYFIPYKWECRNGSSQCYSQNPSSCGYHMCQCDRMFAECLKQQPCPKKKAFCRSAPWRLIQNLLFDFGIAG